MTTQIKAGVIAANAVNSSELASGALSGQNFTGDVTFDTTTLFVDSTNNRVGIGTASPAYKIDSRVSTSASIIAGLNLDASGNSNGDGSAINFSRADNVLSSVAKISAVKAEVSNNETDLVFSNYAAGSLTEKMRIVGATGNVGIGTNNPDTKLHVHKGSAGSVTALSDSSLVIENSTHNYLTFLSPNNVENAIIFGDADSNNQGGLSYHHSTNHMGFKTAGTERMRINAAGGLSINDDVENGLNLNRTTTTTGASYMKFTNGGGNYYIGADSSAGDRMAIGGQAYGFTMTAESGRPLVFATSNTSRMTINSSGRVGIGESDPSNAKLEILQAGDHDAHSTHGIAIHSTGNTNFTSMYMGCEDAIDSAYIQSVALDGSFTSKSLLLNANGGNVGIGTTSPGTLLEINGSEPVLTIRDTRNVGGTGWSASADEHLGEIQFWTSDGTGVGPHSVARIKTVNDITAASPAGRLSFFTSEYNDGSGGWEKMRIASNGPISMYSGSTNTLQLNTSSNSAGTNNLIRAFSDSNISSGGTVRFVVYPSGNVQNSNNSYGQISDETKKENIVDATDKLDSLNQVRVRNFNFIGDDLKQIGVVAQELETIFPSMVEDIQDQDADGNVLETSTKSVKYSVFVPILIKAIQEQQTIIDDLKSRLDEAGL